MLSTTSLKPNAFLRSYLASKFERVVRTADDLHDYQNDGAKFLEANPFSALFIDTGLGKTGITLYAVMNLVSRFESNRILVIAPKRVANVTWPDEIAEWSFAAPLTYTLIRDEDVVEFVNAEGREARAWAKAEGKSEEQIKLAVKTARKKASKIAIRKLTERNPATIHIVSKDNVEFLVDAWGRDWPYDTVIIDESSCLKDHRTKRWKALWKVRQLIKRMHQLTATPASESYVHLFGQISLLDGGERFGKDFTKFTERYFTQNKYTMKWKLRPGAEEEITAKIADICLVMKQEDYLDLQQPIFSTRRVHLAAEQMALYRQMEEELVVTLPDGSEIEAETAAALSQKLLQMASGVLYETVLEEKEEGVFQKRRIVHHLHDEKIDELRELRDEIGGESMLVAYYHKSSLDRILAAFPDAKVMDKEGRLIPDWNNGKIPMLLLHPQSGAHGLNLQRGGRHVVFFDIPWSYELFYQFYRRLARQGQTLLVVIHMLITSGSIDEQVSECLRNKGDMQELLFRIIKRLRLKFRS
jgi:hypothetical protein